MQQYTVTVAEDHLDRIDEVADALRARGFEVEGVLTALGLITVRAEPSSIAAAASVDGVDSVSEAVGYQLPSPDSPIQ